MGKRIKNLKFRAERSCAYSVVMTAYSLLGSSNLSLRLKDFKLDVGKVLKTKCIVREPRERVQFYGALFIKYGLYPVEKYFTSFEYPTLYGVTRLPTNVPSWLLTNRTMTDAPMEVAGELIEKSDYWLNAHEVTHLHFDSLNLSPHKDEDSKPVPGYVYFINDPDKKQIKIGFSNDPEMRLKELRTGCPEAEILVVIRTKDMRAEEYYYHTRFAEDRRGTTEWFYPSKQLLGLIESKQKERFGVA